MKRLVIFVICLATSELVFAEKTDTTQAKEKPDYHLIFSPAYMFSQAVDLGMSPMRYSGSSGGLSIGYAKAKKQYLERAYLNALFGIRKSSLHDVNRAQTSVFTVTFHQDNLWDLGTEEDGLSLGFNTDFFGQFRSHSVYGNNALNYEFTLSLGPSLALKKSFNLFERKFSFLYVAHLPAFGFGMRPSYNYSLPRGFRDFSDEEFASKLGRSLDFISWHNFQQFGNEFILQYHLKNGNKIGLSYNYRYFRINTIPTNSIQNGSHLINFITYFNL